MAEREQPQKSLVNRKGRRNSVVWEHLDSKKRTWIKTYYVQHLLRGGVGTAW